MRCARPEDHIAGREGRIVDGVDDVVAYGGVELERDLVDAARLGPSSTGACTKCTS